MHVKVTSDVQENTKQQLILAVDEEDLVKADHLKLTWRIKENSDR